MDYTVDYGRSRWIVQGQPVQSLRGAPPGVIWDKMRARQSASLLNRHAGIRESDFARLQTSPDCQGRSLGLQNSAGLVKFCRACKILPG
jgi:hypothetical protein